MNIFVLDESPVAAAKDHCDKHVVKMVVETAQILSTVHRMNGYVGGELFRATHVKHPCTVWAGETSGNYMWTYMLFWALCDEYTARYGKVHAASRLLEPLRFPPGDLPVGGRTPFVQAMPEDVRGPDAVAAYRDYYRIYKRRFAAWRYSPEPMWWSEKPKRRRRKLLLPFSLR